MLGRPIYCLISARSTKAKSMASVMLEVVKINTFGYLFSLSICVSRAFTARMASEGSELYICYAYMHFIRIIKMGIRVIKKELSGLLGLPAYSRLTSRCKTLHLDIYRYYTSKGYQRIIRGLSRVIVTG